MSSPPPPPTSSSSPSRLPVRTYHCRFCNHLLIASTRELHRLPRRKEPAKDAAVILPLPPPKSEDNAAEEEEEEEKIEEEQEEMEGEEGGANGATRNERHERPAGEQPAQSTKRSHHHHNHSTLLLSTALPDRKPTLVRREDGIEKRLFLRCGRCRVTIGYFLDSVHFPGMSAKDDRAKVVYLLPGALMETHVMGDEEKMRDLDREWNNWV